MEELMTRHILFERKKIRFYRDRNNYKLNMLLHFFNGTPTFLKDFPKEKKK